MKPNAEHGHSAAFWDAFVLAQGGALLETIMGEKLRAIDDAVAEAKQSAKLDKPARLPGLVGRFKHDSTSTSLAIFLDTRAGDESS